MKLVKFLAAVLVALASTGVGAQGWQQKPVRFIVPFPPGGATDISARLLGEKLTHIWNQQELIENRKRELREQANRPLDAPFALPEGATPAV